MTDNFKRIYGANRVPKDFAELKRAIGEQWVMLFHAELDDFQYFQKLSELFSPAIGCESRYEEHANFKNVMMTNNNKWFYETATQSSDKLATEIPNAWTSSETMMNKWEPFLIVPRTALTFPETLPRYNEIFFGRSKNKISFVNSLRIFQYRFFYIRNEFIIHMEHPYSIYRMNEFEFHYTAMKVALRMYIKEMVAETEKRGFTIYQWDSETEPLFIQPEILDHVMVTGTSFGFSVVQMLLWVFAVIVLVFLGIQIRDTVNIYGYTPLRPKSTRYKSR